jgi:hypothetical protein
MPAPARTSSRSQAAVLGEVLSRARAAAPRGVVVFDLDSTLLDNRPRQARILREYGRLAGLGELLRARPEHLTSWDLADAMRQAGMPAAEVARHRLPLRRFWSARFFESAYCLEDVPLPGAAAFVRDVASARATVAYVTGRPDGMASGTLDSLSQAGFPRPDGARVRLYLKPEAPLGDDEWKARAAVEVARLGEVVAAFDNEPAHLNGYALAFPEALCVHLDTDHSPRPIAVLPHLPSIRDFRRRARRGRGAGPFFTRAGTPAAARRRPPG